MVKSCDYIELAWILIWQLLRLENGTVRWMLEVGPRGFLSLLRSFEMVLSCGSNGKKEENLARQGSR